MIEISWGKPLHLVVTQDGDSQKISTIEQAKYWLKRRWPIADEARHRALASIEAAMDCMMPVHSARRAFEEAATTAGFRTAQAA